MDNARSCRIPISSARLHEALGTLECAQDSRTQADELFMSDIHGADEAFDHLVRSASGGVREVVLAALADTLSVDEINAVCTLLYYPELCEQGYVCVDGVDLTRFASALNTLSRRVYETACGAFHLIGDIWDRGPRGDLVMDRLMRIPDADVQWGNHDICWMGAAAGDAVCIATLLRNNIKYSNLAQFEQGYGISLQPLFDLGKTYYLDDGVMTPAMKAISSILFKLEAQAVLRHPEWHMNDRLLWGRMDLARGDIELANKRYPLKSVDFPFYDRHAPFDLSDEEACVVGEYVRAFSSNEHLQAQISWLYEHGSVYKAVDDLLLFHGCVPLETTGSFAYVDCADERCAGRDLLDRVDMICRRAWQERVQVDLDWMGYLWCGWQSTFAGRVVKTFERTYIEDKETWKEPEDPYYALTRDDPAPCEMILAAFGMDPARARIVNGHTPVKLPKGESPVRGQGKRLVIDGGLCKAYRKTTGIAGYTLRRRADELSLVTHGEYPGSEEVRQGLLDIEHSSVTL